jgi:hypothetical protein
MRSLASAADFGSVSSIIADALHGGIPDARGCSFRIGRAAATRLTDQGAYAVVHNGLHALLADGSWLIGLRHHVQAGPDCILDTDDTGIVDPAHLGHISREVVGWSPDPRGSAQGLGPYQPFDRASISDALAGAPVSLLSSLRDEAVMALPVFLIRAEVPEAARSLVLSAVAMAERDLVAPPQRAGALVVDDMPVEEVPEPVIPTLTPGLAVARGALAWLIASADAGCHRRDPRQTAAILRLLAWLPWPEERRRLHRLCRQAGLLPGSCSQPAEGETVAHLVETLGDPRLSTWRDHDGFGRPVARTVGDSAVLAIARVLGRDPRPLAGIDPGVPWTDEARMRTREGLIRWSTATA